MKYFVEYEDKVIEVFSHLRCPISDFILPRNDAYALCRTEGEYILLVPPCVYSWETYLDKLKCAFNQHVFLVPKDDPNFLIPLELLINYWTENSFPQNQ